MDNVTDKADKIKKRGLPWFVVPLIVIAGVCAATTLWQIMMVTADGMNYSAPGMLVTGLPAEYGGDGLIPDPSNDIKASVHVYARGGVADKNGRKPTAVFLGGWDMVSPALEFGPIINALPRDTRCFVVERPGHGFAGDKYSKRTVANMLKDTLFALREMGEQGPYLLVAQGSAGMEAVGFAYEYPDMVCGIVFIDAPPPAVYLYRQQTWLDTLRAYAQPVPRFLGIYRVMGVFDRNAFVPSDGIDADWYRAVWLKNVMSPAARAELGRLGSNARGSLVAAAYYSAPTVSFVSNAEYGENPEVTRVWDEFNLAHDIEPAYYDDRQLHLTQAQSVAQSIEQFLKSADYKPLPPLGINEQPEESETLREEQST